MLALTQNASGPSGTRIVIGRAPARLCLLLLSWMPFLREVPSDFIARLEQDFLFSNEGAMSLKGEKFRRFYP
jgi:hypothetical protein